MATEKSRLWRKKCELKKILTITIKLPFQPSLLCPTLSLLSNMMMIMRTTTTTTALLYAALSLLLALDTASASMTMFPEDLVAQAREFMAGGRGFEERTHRRFIDSSLTEEQDNNAAHRRTLYEMNEIEVELDQQAPLIAGCALGLVVFILVICACKRRRAAVACKHSAVSSSDDEKDDHTNWTTTDSSSSSSSRASGDDPIYLSETFGPDAGFRDELYMHHFKIQQGKDGDSAPRMVNIV